MQTGNQGQRMGYGRALRLLHPPVAPECDVACFCSDDAMALVQATTAQRTPKLAVGTCHCPIARKQGPAHGVWACVAAQK